MSMTTELVLLTVAAANIDAYSGTAPIHVDRPAVHRPSA